MINGQSLGLQCALLTTEILQEKEQDSSTRSPSIDTVSQHPRPSSAVMWYMRQVAWRQRGERDQDMSGPLSTVRQRCYSRRPKWEIGGSRCLCALHMYWSCRTVYKRRTTVWFKRFSRERGYSLLDILPVLFVHDGHRYSRSFWASRLDRSTQRKWNLFVG